MRRVAMVGAGMTDFGELFELGIKDMVPMAVTEAVDSVDKGFDRADIQAAWFGELVTTDGFATGILADSCGLLDIPVSRLENACATGNDAVRHGMMAIASGMYDVVLVVGADKVRETSSRSTFWDWMGMTRDTAWDFPLGLVAPANFALHAARYLHESPVATREHLAMVAVKNHKHGVTNPKAQMRFEITVEQVLERADGRRSVRAVRLHAPERRRRRRDPRRRGARRPLHRQAGVGARRRARPRPGDAPAQARHDDVPAHGQGRQGRRTRWPGIGPADIDVAEVHDCFTGVELINYEDLGFCEKWGAAKLIEDGETYVGGRIPVNPSGGLKAKGHPPGATGVAQCFEIFEQLRGESTNQVDGAKIGLAHNVGGPTAVSAPSPSSASTRGRDPQCDERDQEEDPDVRRHHPRRRGRRRHRSATPARRHRHHRRTASPPSASLADDDAAQVIDATGRIVAPGLHRRAHPRRRPGVLGHDRFAITPARRDHRDRRQLWVQRPAAQRTIPPTATTS